MIQVTVFFNFSLTNTKKQKKWQNPTILFRIYICGHFDILMSQYGQVKTIWPFRTMQYEFSTIQGMSTDITLQTPANTSDTHKHHSYTPITPTPPIPHPHLRHNKTYPDNKRSQHIPTDTSWRQQTLSGFSHPQTTPGRVWGCQGVSVGAACFCWLQLVHK